MKKLITLFLVSLSIISCSPADDYTGPTIYVYEGVELYQSATEFVYENEGKTYTTRFEKSTNKINLITEPGQINDELTITTTKIYPNYHGSVYDYTVYHTDVVKDAVKESPVMVIVLAYNRKTDAYYLSEFYSNEKFDYNPATYVEVTRTK